MVFSFFICLDSEGDVATVVERSLKTSKVSTGVSAGAVEYTDCISVER